MEMVSVSSSVIDAIGYDRESSLLRDRFTDGDIYDYYAVPAHVHAGFLDAPSKGGFFLVNIRSRYPTKKVD